MTAISILCVQQLIKVPSTSRRERERKQSCSPPEGCRPGSTSRELEEEWLSRPLPLPASHWEREWVTCSNLGCSPPPSHMRIVSLATTSLLEQNLRSLALKQHWAQASISNVPTQQSLQSRGPLHPLRSNRRKHAWDWQCLSFRQSQPQQYTLLSGGSLPPHSLHNRHHRQLFPN